ncbi:RDD family protein [Streptomyces sp. B6B3]|uniref:RDD family protein n=1 Tax=Streptomyces sp. B6B3 TaxID=3153570 RepID=UPI00325D9848
MSSPPAGNASGAPGPDWYPDPSIPGYIRYWNGTSWVPGSSRPEPRDGEPRPTPPAGPDVPGGAPAQGAVAGAAATPELPSAHGGSEPVADQGDAAEPDAERGSALPELRRRGDVSPAQPEPAPAWSAEAGQRQGGADQRVTWGSDEDVSTSPVAAAGRVDPRGQFQRTPAEGARTSSPREPRTPSVPEPREPEPAQDPTRAPSADEQRAEDQPARPKPEDRRDRAPEPDAREQTVGLRLADIQGAAPWRQQVHDLAQPQQQSPPQEQGAAAVAPPALKPPARQAPPGQPQQQPPQQTPQQTPQQAPQQQPPRQQPPQGPPPQRQQPGPAAPPPGVPGQQGPQPAGPGAYGYPPPGPGGPGGGPMAGPPPVGQGGYGYPQSGPPPAGQGAPPGPSGPGGGYGYPHSASPQSAPPEPQPQPLRSAADSPFVQPDMLTAQITPRRGDPAFADVGNVYPAALGRRLLARILDSLLPIGGALLVGWPFIDKARDHIQQQIDAAEHAGVTRDIWLIDGTTGGYLAMVLGVFLGVGLLLEALPTAIWGRSLGKAALRLRVLDVERQSGPSFGAALLRWLVYSVLGVLVIGVVNVLWCLRDRPWRQCWHDKAAGTFVAAG